MYFSFHQMNLIDLNFIEIIRYVLQIFVLTIGRHIVVARNDKEMLMSVKFLNLSLLFC